MMALAQRAGLGDRAAEHVRIARPCGVNAPVKIACLAAGMAAGADSIEDMDLLRHGAMPGLCGASALRRRSGRSCVPLPDADHRGGADR
jgi:hypothetical protein